ncbi:hypothetical protein C8Q79DRAFT_1013442 [Trametes meyenii]|nr:hypothetical protein C8Q79DRAFT_1013442 [Trametes meyenii]
MQYRGYEVWISTSENMDEDVPEYHIEEHSNGEYRLVQCFIASESGKAFTVNWQDNNTEPGNLCDYCVKVYIDGKEVDSWREQQHARGYSEGLQVSRSKLRPWVFADLPFTDEEVVLDSEQEQKLSHLGRIDVEIYRLESMRRAKWLNAARSGEPDPGSGQSDLQSYSENALVQIDAVNEETEELKGLHLHQAKLGDSEIAIEEGSTTVLVAVPFGPDDGHPRVTFQFFYLPLEYLQAEGIVPRSISEPEEAENAVRVKREAEDDSSDEDIPLALLARKRRRATTPAKNLSPSGSRPRSTEEPSPPLDPIVPDDPDQAGPPCESGPSDDIKPLENLFMKCEEEIIRIRATCVKKEEDDVDTSQPRPHAEIVKGKMKKAQRHVKRGQKKAKGAGGAKDSVKKEDRRT